jgi:hypothetical protein
MPATKKAPVRPDNIDGVPVDAGVESWKNIGASMVHIIKIAEYGRRESDLIYGGRLFTVTPQERRLNQSQCHDPANDPFTNGTFSPVALLEDEPDTTKLRNNPNVLDERDVQQLFAVSGEVFSERLVAITNPAAVDRLVEAAKRPETGASVQQLDILKRYRKLLVGEKDEPAPATNAGPDGLPRAVTPK